MGFVLHPEHPMWRPPGEGAGKVRPLRRPPTGHLCGIRATPTVVASCPITGPLPRHVYSISAAPRLCI